MKPSKYKFCIGEVVFYLTVKSEPYYEKCRGVNRSTVKVECICGNKFSIPVTTLGSGSKKSCGCKRLEGATLSNTRHNLSKTRLYRIWASMCQRCNNDKNSSFCYYGARGIDVCDEWNDPQNFCEWATLNGYEEHLTLERIDVNRGYFPQNCKWITIGDQNKNKTTNCFYSLDGETKILSDWVRDERTVVNYNVLTRRLKKGWELLAAMITPSRNWVKKQGDKPIKIKRDLLQAVPGQIFHNKVAPLVVISEEFHILESSYRKRAVTVECKCGAKFNVKIYELHKLDKKLCRRHFNGSRERTDKSRISAIWRFIIGRCTDKNNSAFHNYGGRGIKIEDIWLDFDNFYNWSINNGYASDLTLDRINNNGNYCPENCRWTTYAVQNRNTRGNKIITFNNESKCLADWAEDTRVEVTASIITDRLKKGWSIEDALFKPKRKTKKPFKSNKCINE